MKNPTNVPAPEQISMDSPEYEEHHRKAVRKYLRSRQTLPDSSPEADPEEVRAEQRRRLRATRMVEQGRIKPSSK